MSMRTKILGGLAATCMLATPIAMADIATSAHDFSGLGWSGGEICLACHAPHNNLSTTGLLWNHTASIATYQPYANTATMSSAPSALLGGTSKLCMSCHDGTVALDSYGGRGTPTAGFITGAALVGTDLRNDHPISFVYPTTDAEINPVTDIFTFATGQAGTIADVLDGGSMQCSSCHDVHNTKSQGAPSLLLRDNADSALCLTCHAK